MSGAISRIQTERLLVIVRADEPSDHIPEALLAAGVGVVEISLVSRGALTAIERWRGRFPTLTVGAGTVCDAEQCRAAAGAGAQFAVSPGGEPAVFEAARGCRIPYVPGALTPTEVAACLREGAELIKLFPASVVGTEHMRALLGPFPAARFVPTGGVGAAETQSWLRAGATAVAVGSTVVAPGATAPEIERLAREAVTAVAGTEEGEG